MAREDVRKDPAQPPAPEGGDEHNETPDKYEELKQRVEGQSRLLGKLTSALEKFEKMQAPAPAPEKAPEEKSLTERQRKLEQEWAQKTQKARDRAVKQMIASALQHEGIADVQLATRQANFLKSELADRIAVDDDTDEVTIDDGGQQVPVGKFLHAYLQTEQGNWLLPSKKPANDKNAAKGLGTISKSNLTEDGKLRISLAEFSKGKYSKAVGEKIAKGEFEIISPEDEV